MVTKKRGEVEILAEEQAQDMGAAALDAMAGEVAALDFETSGPAGTAPADDFGPAPSQGAAAPVADPAAEWLMVLILARTALAPLWPFVVPIYTDERLQEVAAAFVPVADKYGVSAGGVFDKWGAELRLAMVLGPLVLQTWLAWKVAKAEAEAVRADAETGRHEANAGGVLHAQGEPPKNAPAVEDRGGMLAAA